LIAGGHGWWRELTSEGTNHGIQRYELRLAIFVIANADAGELLFGVLMVRVRP